MDRAVRVVGAVLLRRAAKRKAAIQAIRGGLYYMRRSENISLDLYTELRNAADSVIEAMDRQFEAMKE